MRKNRKKEKKKVEKKKGEQERYGVFFGGLFYVVASNFNTVLMVP